MDVLFHMEVTTQIIADLVRVFADEVREEELDGEQIKADAAQHLPVPPRQRTNFLPELGHSLLGGGFLAAAWQKRERYEEEKSRRC